MGGGGVVGCFEQLLTFWENPTFALGKLRSVSERGDSGRT